ncbi:MAG TPA: DUF1684 domain-containing protein [Candidatus Angelobacter sp.]|nr:DUF1684 domain-containing protein [Candidatus Angelobacter sp.]
MNDSRAIFPACSLLLILGFLVGCSSARDAAYKQSVEQWRKNHLAKVTSDDGDLTYAALLWLREGSNSFGSAPDNDLVLPLPVPPKAGSIKSQSGKFTVRVNPDVPITMNGKPIHTAELKPDDWDSRMFLGDLTFYIHQAGERFALRMKDKNSKLRQEFTGLRWFPIDPAWRVKAHFVPYSSPREVPIEGMLGDRSTLPMAGYVTFDLHGRSYKLEGLQDNDGSLFFIFRDLTSKKDTYQVRFLKTTPPANGEVELDFNEAYNPPCAFNPYTTCPLPTPGNRLQIEIPAGEKRYHP